MGTLQENNLIPNWGVGLFLKVGLFQEIMAHRTKYALHNCIFFPLTVALIAVKATFSHCETSGRSHVSLRTQNLVALPTEDTKYSQTVCTAPSSESPPIYVKYIQTCIKKLVSMHIPVPVKLTPQLCTEVSPGKVLPH